MDNNPAPTPTPAPEPAPAAPAPAPAADQPLFANNNGGAKKSHTGLIVGLVLGIVAIAAILVVVFVVILPNANKGDDKKEDNTSKNTPNPNPDPDPDPTPTPTNNEKTLVCTTSTEYDDGDTVQDVTVTFIYEDDEVQKISITEETWQKAGFTDAEIEAAQKNNNAYYDSSKFSSWNVKRKDKYTVILEADLVLGNENTENYKTYNLAKSTLTSAGYDCK